MSNERLFEQIASNIRAVRDRMAEAAARGGRHGDSIRLVAVSKYASIGDGTIEAFLKAGCVDLGESRPQTLTEKAAHYASSPIRWHLIGSLQRNKVRKVLPAASLIHSLDSVRLAEAIYRIVEEENEAGRSAKLGPIRCLLEVDVSGDANKHGFTPENVLAALDEIGALKQIVIDGVMAMSGLESDDDRTRREFASVRRLVESLRERGLPPNAPLNEISMGMSDDFEIAVEEGATIVRVGSLLYARDV